MKFSTIPIVLAAAVVAEPIKIPVPTGGLLEMGSGGGNNGGDNGGENGGDNGGDNGSNHGGMRDGPFAFTSTYSVIATPEQVVDANNSYTGGLGSAVGYFNYGINSAEDVICYNITLVNFFGEYASPAFTATHIHEGQRGRAGPPRIAVPNPITVDGFENVRRTLGCMWGPFSTGVVVDGYDTGTGFAVSQIEADPSMFFTDVHSSLAVAGAVRGQLSDGVN